LSVEVFNEIFPEFKPPRPLVERLLTIVEEENLKGDSNFAILLSAPTGYGKSSCTMALAEFIAKNGQFAERLIHVLPLRAIVSDLYRKACSRLNCRGVSVGAQAMHLLDANKTPFFMPRLVYTTFDSFIHNLFKAPVAEHDVTRSHFDVPRYSIYTSLLVFDEAHLFSTESPIAESKELFESHSRMFTAFCTSLEVLSRSLTPLIVMTATMPSKLLKSIIERLKTPYYAAEKRIYLLEYNPQLEDKEVKEEKTKISSKTVLNVEVGDKKFLDHAEKLNPRFKGVIKCEDVCRKALEELERGARVLVVRNTVKEAVKTFKLLKSEGEDTILLHGRLSVRDKSTALSQAEQRLKDHKPFILVATQIIEAGVDLDLDILITDAAPLNSIIQRVGRVGRRPEGSRIVEPAVYVVKGDGSGVYDETLTHKTLGLLIRLNEEGCGLMWRVPRSRGLEGYVGYVEALDMVYADWDYKVDQRLKEALTDIDRYYMLDQYYVKRVLDRLCSFVREEGMFQLSHWIECSSSGLQSPNTAGCRETSSKRGDVWREVYNSLIPVGVRMLIKRWRDILTVENGQIKVLAVSRGGKAVTVLSKALYEALEEASQSPRRKCAFLRKLENSLRDEFRKRGLTAVAPILKLGSYVEGEGLRLD